MAASNRAIDPTAAATDAAAVLVLRLILVAALVGLGCLAGNTIGGLLAFVLDLLLLGSRWTTMGSSLGGNIALGSTIGAALGGLLTLWLAFRIGWPARRSVRS